LKANSEVERTTIENAQPISWNQRRNRVACLACFAPADEISNVDAIYFDNSYK